MGSVPFSIRAWTLVILMALAAAGRAQVVVTPRRAVLRAGQSLTFQAQWAEPGKTPVSWRWQLADGIAAVLDEATGHCTAPPGDEVRTLRILAVHPENPAIQGEAELMVLPHEPFHLLDQILGPDWLEPFSADLPFLDLATGKRFPGRVEVDSSWRQTRLVPGAVGLPCLLPWARPAGTTAQLLSYLEDDQVVRRDVTGQASQEIIPRGRLRECTVECLVPLDSGPEPAWTSHVQRFSVDVRGMVPFAGNHVADGDGWHRDGAGLAARFRAPFGLAEVLGRGSWGERKWGLLVTDPENHVLRMVDGEGRVTTLAGEPGKAGHRDSPGGGRQVPLFRRPTHVAVQRLPARGFQPCWRGYVADSGNHVIRQVDPDGRVETLAGCPGTAGYADRDDPRLALFRDPQGICVVNGNLYVADRGNHVIRKIRRDGQVSTFAGQGQPGTRDGSRTEAQFTDLKGIAWVPYGLAGESALFVVDGHAVRRISLGTGEVRTLLGVVDGPGFQDVRDGDLETRRQALRKPCLRDPVGILWHQDALYIADRGNHAVRWADPMVDARLETLAGDPKAPLTRWGLLRDGLPGPLAPAWAALEAPATLAPSLDGMPAAFLAATGRGIAELRLGSLSRNRLPLSMAELAPAARNQPFLLPFRAETVDAAENATVLPLHCTLDCIDPDGTLAARIEKTLAEGGDYTLEGVFTQPGKGEVVLRVVTGQGISAGIRRTVEVQ